MKVTEKCDVYSFGVLALEVVMGTHPGELLSVLPIEGHQLPLINILDQRLQPPSGLIAQELVLVVKLAFACTRENPRFRPSMHQVSSDLLGTKSPHLFDPLDKLTLHELMEVRKSNA